MMDKECLKLFISYSHADKEWKDYIKSFFKATKKFEIWDDSEILLGDNWHERIQQALQETDIGLFLISKDFLNSQYIANNEMPNLIERAKQEDIVLINVFIKPIPYKIIDWLSKENESIQGFPSPDKPLSSFIQNHSDLSKNNNLLDEKLTKLVTTTFFAHDEKRRIIEKRCFNLFQHKDMSNLNKKNSVKICPYDNPQKFYSIMYDFTKQTIQKLQQEYESIKKQDFSPKILSEKIGEIEHILPSILLLKGDITIYEEIDETPDNNPIDYNFINLLKEKCGKIIYDNPTFRLSNILPKNKLVIGESSYAKSFSTCDKHFYNLIDSENDNMRHAKGEKYEFWYTQLKNIVINENYKAISGSLACSTLVVFKDFEKNRYEYLIMDNSRKKNGNNSRHVIPSFMFQPPKNDNIIDQTFTDTLDIELQMLKEFAEEILGKVEYERLTDGDILKRAINNDPVIQHLKKLLQIGQAEFKILGLSLDIFRLRPEIISVLIIENQEFLEKVKDTIIEHAKNKENKRNTPYICFEVDNVSRHDIKNEARYISILTDTYKPIVPPGAACLKLGRDYVLEKYIKSN